MNLNSIYRTLVAQMCVIHEKWSQVNLTQEFTDFNCFLYALPLLKLIPTRFAEWILIKLQCLFVDYVGYRHQSKTFGGFLENRAALIGFLEDETANMVHLGIDINNICPGSAISVPCNVRVVHVMKDATALNGWGGRIIMKMVTDYQNCPYLLYGHLSFDGLPKAGDIFQKNDVIAKLGTPNENGGWFPHLHVQCLTQRFFDEFKDKLDDLDGYALGQSHHLASHDYVSDPTDLMFKTN